MPKPLKPKQCKNPDCSNTFAPIRSTHKACSLPCALVIAREATRKREARENRARKQKLKTRSEWLDEAQQQFNRYIRLRDAKEPCICCGSYGKGEDWLTGGKWDAGHFLSIGAFPELRFEEDNCHKQLKSCNSGVIRSKKRVHTVHDSERQATIKAKYRVRLINKIGLDRVEWLEGPHKAKKCTIEEIIEIKHKYRKLSNELMRRAA